MTTDSALVRYYELIDRGEASAALELVSESLEFCLARPDERIEGSSRSELARFIADRPSRAHHLLRVATVGDTEFALGASIDADGLTVLGTFTAVMRIDGQGLIDRYAAAFYPALDFGSP